jgi:hypothetical protein
MLNEPEERVNKQKKKKKRGDAIPLTEKKK